MKSQVEMLRPAQVAKRLGLTPSRVYQLIATKELPAVRMGGAIRVPLGAWEEWLRRKAAEALCHKRPDEGGATEQHLRVKG